MGLVNTVVPFERLEDETVAWAEKMMEHSPLALRMIKAGLNAELDGQAGIQELAGDATMLYYMTEEAQEGSIEYEFPVDLEVSAADQAIGYISAYDNVPESLLQEGRDLLVGEVYSVIRKDDLYELTVNLYEKHTVGETIEGKIEITSDDIFPKVITRQAIHEGDRKSTRLNSSHHGIGVGGVGV